MFTILSKFLVLQYFIVQSVIVFYVVSCNISCLS